MNELTAKSNTEAINSGNRTINRYFHWSTSDNIRKKACRNLTCISQNTQNAKKMAAGRLQRRRVCYTLKDYSRKDCSTWKR